MMLASPSASHAQAPDPVLRIGIVLPAGAEGRPEVESAQRGVQLGVEEAARTARLFGRSVELAAGEDVATLVAQGAQALVGGFDEAECEALAALAEARGVVWMNVGCAGDRLRGEGCRRTSFHVVPSQSVAADARRMAGESEHVPVWGWHPTLFRYGAEQLRDRYRARFGGEMDEPAWAGWFAVKALWEASLRARSTEPARLVEQLEREGMQLDGHKGRPLSFRPWDHQLRQPLYVQTAGASASEPALVEIPAALRDEGVSSRDLLDRLGTSAAASACRWEVG